MSNLICTIQGKSIIDIYSDGHAEIILNDGQRVMIDAEDADKCKEHKWYFNTRIIRSTGSNTISLGRYIMNLTNPNIYVRFADGDVYNCRKANLIVRDTEEPEPTPVAITPTASTVIVYKSKGYAELITIRKSNEEVRVKIDLDDIDRCKDHLWRYNSNGAYNSKLTGLHRYLMNATDDVYVKFRNNDKTDCRKANLYFEPKYKQPEPTPTTSKLNIEPKSDLVKKPNLTASSDKNYTHITHSTQGYIILLPLPNKEEKEFMGPFTNKETAILAYEKRVDEIYRAAAIDSYETLVANLKESDPYGLY